MPPFLPHVLGVFRLFLLMMVAGSIFGTFVGGQLLGVHSNSVLLPALAVLLVLSALEVWRHS